MSKRHGHARSITQKNTWETISFSEDIIDLKNGLNFTREQKGNNGLLVIDVFNMYGRGIGLKLDNLYRIKVDREKLNQDYLLRRGDILFVRSSLKKGGAAWAALFNGYSEPVSFCGFIIRSRLKTNKLLPEFVTYYLRTNQSRNKLISISGSVTITNISQESIRSLSVPVPPIKEQEQIVSLLSSVDSALDIVERERGEQSNGSRWAL